MKSALFLMALALTSSVAFSAQALTVGDSVTYSATTFGKTDVVTTTVEYINGDEFTSQTFADGSSLSQTKGSIAKYTQTLSQIIPNCPAQGGKVESLTTPAGTFTTCHQSKDGNDSYTSPDVPFALVKYSIHTNGINADTVLTSFVKH